MAYIQMKHSYKRYKTGDLEIIANNDVSFDIEKGELVVILGASGAGKSTVLNILGGMDTNDEGRVIIDGKDISEYTAKELTTYRREDVGFVFQFYNLVSNLTARENVELASEIVPNTRRSRFGRSLRQLPITTIWWGTTACCHCTRRCQKSKDSSL